MIDVSYIKEGLLRWNYLPNQKRKAEELPPIFTSRNLVPDVADKLLSLKLRKDGYDQIEYQSTRYNNIPRTFSIPHPLGYVHFVNCLCEHWEKIKYICDNENSRVKPGIHNDERSPSLWTMETNIHRQREP